jgi:hypothetical protein
MTAYAVNALQNPDDNRGRNREDVYNPRTPKTHSGTDKPAQITSFQALFDWPVLYRLADTIDELRVTKRQELDAHLRNRGRKQPMPTAVFLALEIGARITGSQASALALTKDPDVWLGKLEPVFRFQQQHLGRSDVFPRKAPNRDQMRYFRNVVLEIDGWHPALQARFQELAAYQARVLGHFDPDAPIEWASPTLAHALIGDGVVIRPLSDVRLHVDAITGSVYAQGSRWAKVGPRVSPTGTDLSADGKLSKAGGLNMVSLHTLTKYGPVIMGTGHAEGAEIYAALDLLDQVAPKVPGAQHLLWDRVWTGWTLDYAAARHRIRVVNKSVAAPLAKEPRTLERPENAQKNVADEAHRNLVSSERADIKFLEYCESVVDEVTSERHKRAMTRTWQQRELMRIFYSNAPVPLGVCLYASTSAQTVTGSRNESNHEEFEVVRSQFFPFGQVSHDTDEGACAHELYVDDAALHTVEYDVTLGSLVKTGTATCTDSQGRRRAGGIWGATDTWSIPCERGAFEITTHWDPSRTRYTRGTDEPRVIANRALNELRPVSRSDRQKFADSGNFRNSAESYNQWYQKTLPHKGRAASLSIDAQLLDYLGAACLRNALTWARYLSEDDQ